MANNKNNQIPIPLNADLNFSKLKTHVEAYSGFNDLNSPLYGDTLTPLHFKTREKNAPGNDRPYLKDGQVYDKYGTPLLSVKNYRGLERNELKEVPASAIAVYDKDTYVAIERDGENLYTAIHYKKDDEYKVIALPYVAINAQYSEKSQHLLFIAQKRFLHAWDTSTYTELAVTPSLDADKANLVTFYDPLNDWNIVSSWEPFADWKYKTLTSYNDTNISQAWKNWEAQKTQYTNNLEKAQEKLDTNKATYERLSAEKYSFAANGANLASQLAVWKDNRDSAIALLAGFSWTVLAIPFYAARVSECNQHIADIEAAIRANNEASVMWEINNGALYATTVANFAPYQQEVSNAEKELADHNAAEPDKYGESLSDHSYFIGQSRTPAYNFIFDQRNNTFTRKKINLPFNSLKPGSRGPDEESYVITGIYDMHLKQSNGKWQSNTNEDYIRYRLAVIPHGIKEAPRNASGGTKIFFMLSYTPKIYFRQRNANASWSVGSNIKDFTKCYLLTRRSGWPEGRDSDFFMSGTGKNAMPMTWMSVLFELPSTTGSLDYNKVNLTYDLGGNKYTFYSPWSTGDNTSGNNMNIGVSPDSDKQTAKGLGRGYFNFEISGSGLDYIKPETDGEEIKANTPNFIFREIINNGVRDNIAVTEKPEAMGTMLETMGSLDDDTPIFYREGKDGHSAIFKTTQNKWIEINITETPTDIKLLGDRFAVIMTPNNGNTIDLETREIRHFAPDWNNRFSFYGSPYLSHISALKFPATNITTSGYNPSKIKLASGINSRFEITGDPITGYSSDYPQVWSNESNITPVGYVSEYDTIDWYFDDLLGHDAGSSPDYYISMNPETISYSLFTNIDLAGVYFPSATRIPGLFCSIKPSNFGRFYLDDGNVFYSLLMYNGNIFYAYYTNSVIDDVKELFMVQGQTYAITKSDYLYSVFIDQRGVTSLADAIANVKGLKFCGAIPEMAVFYAPLNRTLKAFTADHMIKDLQPATAITYVGTSSYNPQTNAIYIPTNNGVYVFSAQNKYRLPIFSLEEVYFGGWNNEHTYFKHIIPKEDGTEEVVVTDYVCNPDTAKIPSTYLNETEKPYELQPVILETRYYGQGQNGITNTDCIYFRLYSDIGPIDSYIEIKESTITDGVYNTFSKKIPITKAQWDKDTNTCYVRYQPKYQKSVGLSIKATTTCSISEMTYSVSNIDTQANSKPLMNM